MTNYYWNYPLYGWIICCATLIFCIYCMTKYKEHPDSIEECFDNAMSWAVSLFIMPLVIIAIIFGFI